MVHSVIEQRAQSQYADGHDHAWHRISRAGGPGKRANDGWIKAQAEHHQPRDRHSQGCGGECQAQGVQHDRGERGINRGTGT